MELLLVTQNKFLLFIFWVKIQEINISFELDSSMY